MAFDALAAGADHMVWYGASALDLSIESQHQIWTDLQATVNLVSQLAPALERPAIRVAEPAAVKVMARQIDDGFLVVVINRSDTSTTAAIDLPFAATEFFDFETGATLPSPADLGFEAELEPWEVKVVLASGCGA